MAELHDEHRSLRLNLTCDAHLRVLREHLDEHGTARLTETDTVSDTAWIGGHVHEVVMPFTRIPPPTPSLAAGALPLVTNNSAAHRPAAPGTSWLYAQVFTHPERSNDIIRTHLPRLLAALQGDPAYWFTRYRSVRETDHLRLRIRVAGPGEYAAVAVATGEWGQQLCEIGAASRITLATYHPEVGRYGSGGALDAAERVFAADSHAVALAFRLLPPKVIQPVALAAIGMTAIANAFHTSPDRATGWLLTHLPARSGASADRPTAQQAIHWAARGTLPDGSSLPPALQTAWRNRDAELSHYRRRLPGEADTDRILSALLHMHHNRARSIDRADEAICRRLVRQIALARRARSPGNGA